MMRLIYTSLFRLAGWKISGDMPRLKKYIIIVAPHTSNIDFFIGSRTVFIGEAFKPGNHDEDWKRIAGFYADKTGKYPKPLPENLKKYLSL